MRLLITGAGGMLARALRLELPARGHEVLALTREALDVRDPDGCRRTLERARPDAVLHCAAYTRVDDAESDEGAARALNADATANVARACGAVGARLVYPSTDYVFDGSASTPYPPDAPTAPLNAYGRTKLEGERLALSLSDALVVRTSWLYGAGGRNFVATILERAASGEPLRVVDDQHGSPTWTHDLAHVLARLLENDASPGVYHACGGGETTWYGFAREAIRLAGLTTEVQPVTSDAFPRRARRPRNSRLDCSTTEVVVGPMRDWREALAAALRAGVQPQAPVPAA